MPNDFNKADAIGKVMDVLQETFGPDVVLDVTADEEADVYWVKARASNETDIATGYQKLVPNA